MNRRTIFAALAAIATSLTLPAAAQPTDPARRVGVLMLGAEEPANKALLAALLERLQQLGWTDGRNLRLDVRWAGTDTRSAAAHLVQSAPDVVVAQGGAGIAAVQAETRTIPLVFVQVSDPVAAGLVASAERPEGNITGVANFPPSIAGDRVRVLKQIAPHLDRIALVHDRNFATPPALLRAAETAAAGLGLEVHPAGARHAEEMERQLRETAAGAKAGLIVFPSPFTVANSQRIIALTAELRLPAIYPLPNFAVAGGLISYGVNTPALWREAAALVDRILRGADPAGLAVHEPTSVDIVVNARTAKALGITMPASLMTRAGKVIE